MVETLILLDELLIRSFLAGTCLVLVSGPLGCLVVWNRMAYFGDALTHSSMLGLTLGFLLAVNTSVAVLLSAVIFAVIISLLSENTLLHRDSYLGIIAHAAFALGILLLGYYGIRGVDLHAFLFGDILTVTETDIALMSAVTIIVWIILGKTWKTFLRLSINEGIAASEGVNVRFYRTLNMVMIALVVGVSVRITGVLLVSAFLIIPASAARYLAASPRMMAAMAILIGMLSLLAGLALSFSVDVPTGPAIIFFSALFFFGAFFLSPKK